MQQRLKIAQECLLTPTSLTFNDLHETLTIILATGVDGGDLYFESSQQEAYILEDGIIKSSSYAMDKGVGIRAWCGEKSALAYSNDLSLAALKKATLIASSIAKRGNQATVRQFISSEVKNNYVQDNPLNAFSSVHKIELLRNIETELKLNPHLVHYIISLSGSYSVILIAGSDGELVADLRPLTRISVSVVLEKNGKKGEGTSGGGGRYLYQEFVDKDLITQYAKDALRQAEVNLEAIEAPAGTMTVVLGNGWPGILLHEAVGHGLEGDFNRKGTSVFSGRVGEKVASSLCTIVDDGTLAQQRGSINIDDEGTETQRTVLIENGILKGYMQDKLNARLMRQATTGNGRRESYAYMPLPRMTNTFMLPGVATKDEIISSVAKGIYAPDFGGGSVDITSGKFVFSASEAYLIENGKITRPIKGVTLIGSGHEVLQQVSMVGNDFNLDDGNGSCGKEGQSIPVGVGQPTLKIDKITVGGTEG